MKAFSCLLLALLASSAFLGVCYGKVWFEGTDPQGPHKNWLMIMQHTIETSSSALPVCNVFLNEIEPDNICITVIVSTWALSYQNENFETWLSIDSQKPEKLAGVLDVTPSAAGEFYERIYNVTLSGLEDGTHLIKIRVAGEFYGKYIGNYDCEGNVSITVDHSTPTEQNHTEPPTTELFPVSSIIAAASILIAIVVAVAILIASKRKKSI